MKNSKRLIASILEVLIGVVLFLGNIVGTLDDYWSGMGTALIVVGCVQFARRIKYSTNKDYKEAVDVGLNDERNKFIGTKAWSWAGYMFVLIAAIASIVLKIIGYDELVPIASGSVCLIMVLYWISYLYLCKKY